MTRPREGWTLQEWGGGGPVHWVGPTLREYQAQCGEKPTMNHRVVSGDREEVTCSQCLEESSNG